MMPPDVTAQMDQASASMRTMAEAMGAYRKSLVDAGIRSDVADDIVKDFAERWHVVILPPANPLAGIFGGKE